MDINRVVFCLNSSPVYSGMWDIVSEVYTKTTDFTPTLIFCGTQDELDQEVKSNFGEVYLFPRYPEVIQNPNLDWSTVWTLFWAIANKFPNDICLFSGIDEIPISTVLWDRVATYPDNKYIVPLGADPYRIYRQRGLPYYSQPTIATGHNCGKGSTFKRIFQIENDLQDELQKVWNCRDRFRQISIHPTMGSVEWWGIDEAYTSKFVYDHPDVIFFEEEWVQEYLQGRKIDRSVGCSYDINKLKEKYYWTTHLVRPLAEPNNMQKVSRLLADMGI